MAAAPPSPSSESQHLEGFFPPRQVHVQRLTLLPAEAKENGGQAQTVRQENKV